MGGGGVVGTTLFGGISCTRGMIPGMICILLEEDITSDTKLFSYSYQLATDMVVVNGF